MALVAVRKQLLVKRGRVGVGPFCAFRDYKGNPLQGKLKLT